MTEAEIIVNGVQLTPGQSMALRVAVTSFRAEMSAPGALGDDEHGRRMARAYRERLDEVMSMMLPAAPAAPSPDVSRDA